MVGFQYVTGEYSPSKSTRSSGGFVWKWATQQNSWFIIKFPFKMTIFVKKKSSPSNPPKNGPKNLALPSLHLDLQGAPSPSFRLLVAPAATERDGLPLSAARRPRRAEGRSAAPWRLAPAKSPPPRGLGRGWCFRLKSWVFWHALMVFLGGKIWNNRVKHWNVRRIKK